MTTLHTSVDFEKTLSELSELVKQMETGQLPLETALTQFERGIKLIRQAQTTLANAEQRVQQLTETQTND